VRRTCRGGRVASTTVTALSHGATWLDDGDGVTGVRKLTGCFRQSRMTGEVRTARAATPQHGPCWFGGRRLSAFSERQRGPFALWALGRRSAPPSLCWPTFTSFDTREPAPHRARGLRRRAYCGVVFAVANRVKLTHGHPMRGVNMPPHTLTPTFGLPPSQDLVRGKPQGGRRSGLACRPDATPLLLFHVL